MHPPGDYIQRVLVVDDDPAIQQMFSALLKREGISIDVALDGEIALQCLRCREYDAVLLDLMLPRTNGFEVIRHLKCLSPDVLDRVIVVTAASQHTLQYLDADVVRKVLRKPFDINELVAEIRDCMAQRSQAESIRAKREPTVSG
jgi:DNA-binding response OmpR family regulator